MVSDMVIGNQQGETINDLYEITRGQGFGKRSPPQNHDRYLTFFQPVITMPTTRKRSKSGRLIHEDFLRAFSQVDVLLAATSPFPAFKLWGDVG